MPTSRKRMKNLPIVALLLGSSLLGLPLLAQPAARAAFVSNEASALHKARFAAAVRRAGFRIPADQYYKHRIDVTQEAALRRAGLDLRELERNLRIDGPGGHLEMSLYADLVVRGTVIGLVTDSSRRVCYHSRYQVRVAETWQGQPADTIMVRLATGPLGDTNGFTFSGAPRLALGEDVILHLNYVDFAAHEEAKKLGISTCANNADPDDFQPSLATPVQGEWVLSSLDQRPEAKLVDLRRNLQRIAAILDKEHFYQKEF